MAEVAGLPESARPGWFAALAGTTEIENGARLLTATPSLTVIAIFEYKPALAAAGLPERAPVAVSKVAQAGLLPISKVNGAPVA
jgi:hypothetical protein